MAKKSWITKYQASLKLIQKYKAKRDAFRKILKDPQVSMEDKWKAQVGLQKLPRRSSRSALTTRCAITGRSRGVERRYGLCRQKIREYALKGDIPGIIRASW